MKKGTLRTILKYTLVQTADLALLVIILLMLRRWFSISFWLMAVVIIFWILKDIALFPLLRSSYEGAPKSHPMIGARGFARDRLDPSGYVWVRGELWHAEVIEGNGSIEAGEPLRVVDAQGLKLLVVSDEKD